MAYPPFMTASSTISRALSKIKEAKTPDRFTQDFLSTVLGISGGSAKAFIPFAKKLGLLESDGSPTELYKQFRNPTSSSRAMAKAIKRGYASLYEKNEYVHKLDKEQLEGLVMQLTGLEKSNSTLRAIISSFENLKSFSNFEDEDCKTEQESQDTTPIQIHPQHTTPNQNNDPIQLGLSYTINLVLPKTSDISVFNAIFKSLRDNLIGK